MTVAFATDELFSAHEQPGHPERPARLGAIVSALSPAGLLARMLDLPARDATDEELAAVHDPALIAALDRLAAEGGGWVDADTYVTAISTEVARRATGAVLAATDAVLDGTAGSAFAVVRPPGHHATRQRAMGFCLFNHVAVAAEAALRRGLERVAIVDWDVHHGNGTQAIFDGDPRVLYFSTHASPFYPGTGAVEEAGVGAARGTKVNVPLPHGAGDEAFLAAYEQVAIPALDRFAPQLVLVSSGWDAHARDPLATLAVTTAGYTRVARLVLDAAARHCEGRIVVALEGGYDEHALAHCARALVELLLGDEPHADPEPHAGRPAEVTDIREVIARARVAAGLG